ncbi:D-alanyl-D-alanine carboxypeptidase family protein [Actinoallomurus rhizosphaericola]|uniref:D-alanyl-D-alanine carboxypeptidase family protein n=1 Tax=Actinoallomurus rhizosphaericola TaxID=2952536 RepID=UPI002092B32B|nr:serine hydrolase [Actinoallomurus rhizosphaericola]MCO5994996.1 serine hydrolase [Actinoallomurus rhizosphaericola]
MRRSARLAAATVAGALISSLPLAAPSALAAAPSRTTAARVVTAASAPSGVAAKGAYIYDASKGKKLWGRATTTKRPIGSMTKVMTALVVIRAGNLDRTVTIKKSYVDHVKNNDASTAGLKTGDKLTVRQLLSGMMLPSGCDAAYALADVYGPGQTKFLAKMNKTAKSLGMTSTYFRTADGLPTSTKKEGYSTPSNVIKLTTKAMASSTFRSIVAQKTYKLSQTSSHKAYSWTNTNLLLGQYSGTIGIKTGHTDAAGYCLLFAAKRGGRTIYGLVLNSTTTDPNRRFTDAAKMLDWAYGTKSAQLHLQSVPAGPQTD